MLRPTNQTKERNDPNQPSQKGKHYNRHKSNTVKRILKKLKINLADESVIPLLVKYPKDSFHSTAIFIHKD